MALEADEIAKHEKQMSAIRAVENSIPSWQRRELYDAPLVRSTQAGGSGTRRRVGTEDEARAIAAVKGRAKNTGKDKGRGKGKRKTKDLYHLNDVSYDSLSFLGAEGDLLLQEPW